MTLPMNWKKIILILLGITLIAFIIGNESHLAQQKPLWDDEGNAHQLSCQTPYFEMLLHGARGQASAAPLYYILEKFLILNTYPYHEFMLVHYRAISLLSSAFIFLLLYFFTLSNFGFFTSLIAILSLNFQHLFHYYSTEARPYMLWMAFFTLSILFGAKLSFEKKSKTKTMTFFTLSSIGLFTTASPGIFQVGVSSLICIYFWFKEKKNTILFFLPLLTICGIMGFHYALNATLIDADVFDLLKTKDFRLIKAVIRLLLPKANIWDVPLNIFLFIGVFTPWLYLNKKIPSNLKNDFAFHLSLHVLAQIALTVFIGFLVAIKHYYFIQRVFIYLIPCRVILISVGGFISTQWLLNKFSNKKLLVQNIILLLLLFGLGFSFHQSKKEIDKLINATNYRWKTPDNKSCDRWAGKIQVLFPKGNLKSHFPGNFSARMLRELKRCNWKNTNKTQYVLGLSIIEQNNWYKIISKDNWHQYEIFLQCGKPVILQK